MKGILVVYVNYHPDAGEDPIVKVNHWREQNKELQAGLKELGWLVMFVLTTKEACRVEKIDLDKPYPRFVGGMDVAELEKLTDAMGKRTLDELNKEP